MVVAVEDRRAASQTQTTVWAATVDNSRAAGAVEAALEVAVVSTAEEFVAGISFRNQTCGHCSTAVFDVPLTVSCLSLGLVGPGSQHPGRAKAIAA